MNGRVLVLNASFEPINVCTERRAVVMIFKGVARIECHYFMNNAFFDTDNYLIENVGRIRHIPAVIVQGRYDVVCPLMSAWELHRAWPEADLKIIPDAGHSALEPGTRNALIEATDGFKRGDR